MRPGLQFVDLFGLEFLAAIGTQQSHSVSAGFEPVDICLSSLNPKVCSFANFRRVEMANTPSLSPAEISHFAVGYFLRAIERLFEVMQFVR